MSIIEPCMYCYGYDYKREVMKRRNAYGTILSDITTPFCINTERYKFKRCKSCNQPAKNLVQTYWFDYPLPDRQLVDNESDLRNLPRKLSRLPQSRYTPKISMQENFDDDSSPLCPRHVPTNMATNCQKRIITSYYWDGPTYNNVPDVTYMKG